MIWHRFWRDHAGAAAVEFAVILPLMVTLILGGAAANGYIDAISRAERAARTMGELLSGAAPRLSPFAYLDYADWAREVARMKPGDVFRQSTALYQIPVRGTPQQVWRRGDNLVATAPPLELYRRPDTTAWVIVVHVSYRHAGVVRFPFFSGVEINRTLVFPSRYGQITITN